MFKKLKKHWKRILSIILVAAICMQDASYIVYADENPPEELSCEAQTGKSGIYEYTSFDAGSAGALDVNLYLGTLHLRRTDLDIGGERMPVAIEFYFDPVNVTVGNPYGAGWNSVYAQVITYDTLTGTYSYKDENGTWISFKNSGEINEAGASIWVEDNEYGVGETGRELYIPASAANTDYTSVDMVYGEDHYAFDASGHLVRISNGTNQISIAYEPTMGYRIDYVTDSVGRKYDFVYTGQYLSQIMALTASDSTISGTTINYTITDGKLMSVAYSTANVVNYTYDANGNMASIANIDGCGFGIIYVSGTNEVTTVVQKAGMGTTQETEGTATTIVRTDENKATVTVETTREMYTFDNCGRVENYELQTITSLAEGQSIASASFDCVYGYNMSYGYITNEDGTITNGVVDVETYDEDGVIEEDEETTEDTEEESTEDTTEDTDSYETTTDEYGNILTETHIVDGLKQTTQYTYSSDGNYLSSVTDENGNTVSYTYNSSSGLLTALKDGNGKTTSYTYNALRELASVKMSVSGLKTSGTSMSAVPVLTSDGNTMQANYTYSKGRLTKLVSGDSTYTFTYDIWGNVLTVKMNSMTLATYQYGNYASKGQVQTLTYGNGQKVFYTYDALGQVATVGYTGQLNRFKYSYAKDGTVSEIYDSVLDQNVAYDKDGYTIRKGSSSSVGTILYAYSAGEDGSYGEIVYGRDIRHIVEENDDVTILTVKDNSNNNIFETESKTDGFGRVEYKKVFTDNFSIRQDFGYITNGENTGNLVTDYDVCYLRGTQKNYLEYGYTYDGNGNITKEELKQTITAMPNIEYETMGESVIQSTSESTTYTYDQAGQLKTSYNSRTGIKYYYTYDANGNIVCREEYSVASDNTETLVEKISYVYSGTVLGMSHSSVDGYVRYTNDNMGNPIKIQKGTTTYNLTWGEGRMLKGISKDTSNNVTYSYNVDGLRTQKVVKENGVSTVTEYVWGNNGLAGMKTELGTVVVLYDAEGQPIGFSLYDTIYQYVKNLQGDVIRILDENGNTVVEYSYDPWGVPTVTGDTEFAKINPCSYRGYDYDEETKLYYISSRYYNPDVGRFISSDVLLDTTMIVGFNIFAYCGNNPIVYVDPSGYGRIYVIYYNDPNSGFYQQAMNSPYYNRKNKNVYMIGVKSNSDFINAWNRMSGQVDYVFLYLHGGKGVLYFKGESLGFYGNKSFNSLKSKKVKRRVYLLSCKGGAGSEGNNVAWMFANLTSAKVYACTGSVSYSKLNGKYYARKAGDWGIFKTFYYEKRYIYWGEVVAKSMPGQW